MTNACQVESLVQRCEHYTHFRKQLAELESEKRYLEKSNKHLEKILEATKAHSKHEVSQLNKIHHETIKVESSGFTSVCFKWFQEETSYYGCCCSSDFDYAHKSV